MFKAQHTIITPVIGYNFKTALTVHSFHSQGSIPCRAAYRGIQANTYTTLSFISYRVPIYTPGWRAAMWIKCLAEGQKCQALMGIEPATLWSRVKGSLQYTTAHYPWHLLMLRVWASRSTKQGQAKLRLLTHMFERSSHLELSKTPFETPPDHDLLKWEFRNMMLYCFEMQEISLFSMKLQCKN